MSFTTNVIRLAQNNASFMLFYNRNLKYNPKKNKTILSKKPQTIMKNLTKNQILTPPTVLVARVITTEPTRRGGAGVVTQTTHASIQGNLS